MSIFRTCKCPKHVEAIYENKIILNCCIKLVHLLTFIYMMHGHTYIKFEDYIYACMESNTFDGIKHGLARTDTKVVCSIYIHFAVLRKTKGK